MEPRPHERGKGIRLNHSRGLSVALQWSHVLTNVERMIAMSLRPSAASLQWSHVLTNVESSIRPRRIATGQAASMEPRPHERGKQFRLDRNGLAVMASMEPRPHERGKHE